MSTSDPIWAGFGIGCSALCILAVGAVLVAGFAGKLNLPFRKTVVWVLLLCFLSSCMRLTWWAVEFSNQGVPPNNYLINLAYVMNRLAWLTSCLAFVLLLFGWARRKKNIFFF
jgi:hypothetical protein